MCSVSWLQNNQYLSICFNRDEQKTRSCATTPKLFSQNSIQALSPIDPDGGGSWLSVNNMGITLCLLNLYEATTPSTGKKISRGQIIKKLSFVCSIDELNHWLNRQNLSKFHPFRLLFISESDKTEYQWTGIKLSHHKLGNFATSSSFETERVTRHRMDVYHRKSIKNPQQQLKLHSDHQPEKSPYSICMHRKDATTVSLSHLTITQQTIHFDYWDGAPCLKTRPHSSFIKRIKDV